MSEFKIVQTGDFSFLLCCSRCYTAMGVVDHLELEYATRGSTELLCFDCDPAPASLYHPIFTWMGEPFDVIIDNQFCRMDWPKSVVYLRRQIAQNKEAIKNFFEFLEERNKAVATSLSSYSKVHNATTKGSSNGQE